ncbi:MAG: radical SAM protein [Spirochaeta sp.]|jgi:cyclic pyranopterin phosphate synthase|nr:radical SAM protein [Spirochaeta sp.]
MHDTFGRRINYLRMSVTDKCNLRCTYCMPAHGVRRRRHEEIVRIERFIAVATAAREVGVTKIRLTGGEPLVRRGILELVQGIGALPGIEKLGMTTNGTLLAPVAESLRAAGMTHLNISIDSLDPRRYRTITRGGSLEDALNGVFAAVAAGFTEIKINKVVTGDPEDARDEQELRAFCEEYGFRLQRIAEYSLSEEKRDAIGVERPLPCEECNRIRMLSNGNLKPCLHSNTEIPIDWTDIKGSIRQAIMLKPERGAVCDNRSMVEIGG